MSIPWLSSLIFIPLGGASGLFLLKDKGEHSLQLVRWVSLAITLVVFCISLVIYQGFDTTHPHFQYTEQFLWVSSLGISYHLGVDGLSLPLVMLSSFLMPFVILINWTQKQNLRVYMASFLTLEAFILAAFCSLDLFLFYIFFESTLIPMFFIIGIWGGENRIYAAFKLFLYTFFGSVFMLAAIIYIQHVAGTSSIPSLLGYLFSPQAQTWLWMGFFLAFSIKLPLWPFHTWLPNAHVEAPTGGSVVLAGLLLKLGGYGMFRLCAPLFPDATLYFQPFVCFLSIVALIYSAFVALVQEDIKKLVAYSSVSHMAFVTLGLFSLKIYGLQGAYFQMISHGLISSALFLCVGMIYERLHTRQMKDLGGLASAMPFGAFFFMVFTLASLGLPGTIGFLGEFFVLLGTFFYSPFVAFLAATGMVWAAAYGLWLYKKVMLGACFAKPLQDLNAREKTILFPLCACVIFFGFYPQPLFSATQKALEKILVVYEKKPPLVSHHIPKKNGQ